MVLADEVPHVTLGAAIERCLSFSAQIVPSDQRPAPLLLTPMLHKKNGKQMTVSIQENKSKHTIGEK